MSKDDEIKGYQDRKEVKIEDFSEETKVPETYSSLVSDRLKKREDNIMGKLDDMLEDQLRFTVRIFADCMEEEEMERFLDGYSEYMVEDHLRKFVEEFVPRYTEYAISELERKKEESEDFEPDHLTGEELQEMAIKEKWPLLAVKPEAFSPLRLRREIAKLALCLRPYMLADPAWNESLLEYSLYFDLQKCLEGKKAEELHAAVRELNDLIMKAENTRVIAEKEEILKEIRVLVLKLASMGGEVEEKIGPQMEHYPVESPEGWEFAEFRNNLEKLSLTELRMSALVFIEMLTLKEMEELSKPFVERHASFYDMSKESLIDMMCAFLYAIGDREILNFYERYTKGKMMIIKPIAPETWNLLPLEQKLNYLREDNAAMDLAVIARHIGRIYLAEKLHKLYNYEYQIDLLKNEKYMQFQAHLVNRVAEPDEGKSLRALNDDVTVAVLDIVSTGERMKEKYAELREHIAKTIGLDETQEPRD